MAETKARNVPYQVLSCLCVSRFFLGLEFASFSISQDLSTKFNNVDKQVRYIANDLREVSREADVTQHLIPFWILLWRP